MQQIGNDAFRALLNRFGVYWNRSTKTSDTEHQAITYFLKRSVIYFWTGKHCITQAAGYSTTAQYRVGITAHLSTLTDDAALLASDDLSNKKWDVQSQVLILKKFSCFL